MSIAPVAPIRGARPTRAEWLSPQQVCDRVPGLTLAILQDMRKRGVGPRYHKPTLKTVIYSAADIDTWVESAAVETRRA